MCNRLTPVHSPTRSSQKLITQYGRPIAQGEIWTPEGFSDRLVHFVIETEQVCSRFRLVKIIYNLCTNTIICSGNPCYRASIVP
jgi:hypothetical protein